jgi:uncharacterized protein (DUF885 family)
MTHRSPIFEISDVYIDQEAALSPMGCTYLGNGLNQDKLDDFSIAAAEVSANLTRETLAKLSVMQPIDEIDRIAKAVMTERLESGLALHDSQEGFVLWNVLASPPSNVRSIFELMPKNSAQDFDNIAKRLAAVDAAYSSWCETIMTVAKSGKTTAQRQVKGVIEQLDSMPMVDIAPCVRTLMPKENIQQYMKLRSWLKQHLQRPLHFYVNSTYQLQPQMMQLVQIVMRCGLVTSLEPNLIFQQHMNGARKNLRQSTIVCGNLQR